MDGRQKNGTSSFSISIRPCAITKINTNKITNIHNIHFSDTLIIDFNWLDFLFVEIVLGIPKLGTGQSSLDYTVHGPWSTNGLFRTTFENRHDEVTVDSIQLIADCSVVFLL